jgi:RNA polymerase sigma-70 factor (ECF subfamily)
MKHFPEDVKLAGRGDTDAFARLYAEVYEDLYHIALYNLRNSHDACDVVSDTVLDAFSSIGKLRDENAFRSWIMKILSAKIKRKQREYFNGSSEIDGQTELTFDFDYLSVDVREALENLDSEERMILSMSVLGGYTSKEIAEICGIKASTVRSRLTAIRKRLRISLE